MKGTGVITRPVAMDCTSMKMEINMKGNGKTTYSMATERNDGPMEAATRALTIKEQSTE